MVTIAGTTGYIGSKSDYLPSIFGRYNYHKHKLKVPFTHYDRYLQGSWEEEMLLRLK